MRKFFTIIFLSIPIFSFGQGLTFEDWQNESKINKRLLPRYGDLEKTKEERKADDKFKEEVMKSFKTEEAASNHMIDLGFQYLYRGQLKTAMYRFNQAYLLYENNPNTYWGYGAVYMAFGKADLAREQYQKGLSIDPKNDNILIDYGTTYLGEYYDLLQTDVESADKKLDLAIEKLLEAYQVNPSNANSSYKLSICYFSKDNCEKANEYLSISEEIGNPNITQSYKRDLRQKCSPNEIDCSSMKTGKFKIVDSQSGETLIERTEKYQIEENKKFGYKLKLEITWIDDCTYKLKPIEDLLDPDNQELPEMIVTCEIVELTENGYVQVSSSDVTPIEIEAEVIRIE